jgi:hypothetical protein
LFGERLLGKISAKSIHNSSAADEHGKSLEQARLVKNFADIFECIQQIDALCKKFNINFRAGNRWELRRR